MAFQKRKSGGDNPAAFSIALSVKQGKGYIKGPSFSFWPNDQGGPAFKGTLKEDRLAQVLEFLSNAYEENLPVSMAMFDNSEGKTGGGFKKPGGFKPKKPNPFKPRQEEQEEGEEPGFGDE